MKGTIYIDIFNSVCFYVISSKNVSTKYFNSQNLSVGYLHIGRQLPTHFLIEIFYKPKLDNSKDYYTQVCDSSDVLDESLQTNCMKEHFTGINISFLQKCTK